MALEDQIFGVSWSDGSADSFTVRPTITANALIKQTITLGTGTVTDQEEQIGFDVANIKGILIAVSDNDNTTVVLETNATDATGGQTFTFPAGGAELFWTNRSPVTCPITTDVETTFWTKTGTDTPTVKIRVFLNP